MKTIFRKDYCKCEHPASCAFGFWMCGFGCGKPIKQSIKTLRGWAKLRKELRRELKVKDERKNKRDNQEKT